MRLSLAAVLGLFVVTACLCQPTPADDWPQFRGPARDGKSTETGVWSSLDNQPPKLLWMAEGVGKGYASASVVGDRLYTSGNSGKGQTVTALSTADGKIIWQTPITDQDPKHGYGGSRTTPTVDGNRLYAVASSGRIVCLDAGSGQEVWSRSFKDWGGKMMSGWGFSESPLVDESRVICTPGGASGLVVALDNSNGQEIWAAKLPDPGAEKGRNGSSLQDGAGYASAMISNGGGVKQYVQLVGRGVVGVRASDGQLLWRYSSIANATANIPTVLIDGDFVFCSTAYGTGSALLKLTAAGDDKVAMNEVYQLKANQLQNKHGGMVLVDGYVYCGDGDGAGLPICVKLSDGTIAWGPERAAGRGESSMAYADGVLVFRRQSGHVLFVRATPKEFTLLGSFKPEYQEGDSWAYPVIANGRLYLREQDKLMCYQLR